MRLQPGLQAGDRAADFELADEDGRLHRLADYRGRWLVVFFYPKDHTPGCTVEACRFGDHYDRFAELGAEVVGVSGDDAPTHKSFAAACRLRYHLLSDPGRVLREAWGVPHLFGHLSGRTTYVLDPQGRVGLVIDDRSHPAAHVDRALAFLAAATAPRPS